MAIKCESYETVETNIGSPNVVLASLIADTSAEVISMGDVCSGVEGLQDGTKLSWGSDCFTVEQDLGILDSSGAWQF